MRGHKPILGFGPFGWTAAAVLALLLIALALCWDPQHAWFTFISSRLGTDGLDRYYWGWFHLPHGRAWHEPVFSTLSVIYVVIAMRIAARRIHWTWYALFIGWGLVRPVLIFHLVSWKLHSKWWFVSTPDGLESTPIVYECALDVAACLLLAIMAKSWRLFVVTAVVTIAIDASIALDFKSRWTFGTMGGLITRPTETLWPALIWHSVMIASLLSWAIHDRLHVDPASCVHCGYDLRGAAHDRCPECGHPAAQRQPAPSPRGRGGGCTPNRAHTLDHPPSPRPSPSGRGGRSSPSA